MAEIKTALNARIEVLASQNNTEGLMWKDITQAIDKAVKQDKVLTISPIPQLQATDRIRILLSDLRYDVYYDLSATPGINNIISISW